MKARDAERQSAIDTLREIIKPGDTVYTVLRHVSRSGMTRGIDVYIMAEGTPRWITAQVGKAIDNPQSMNDWQKGRGLRVGGCGMDMGFAVVYDLSHVLYGSGYACLGDGKCPSNYHCNHHNRVRCEAKGDGFCYQSQTIRHKVQVDGMTIDGSFAFVIERDGQEQVCPTCEGKGYVPNPDGPERFDLTHTDGYALKHKWL